jgi:MFS family permease
VKRRTFFYGWYVDGGAFLVLFIGYGVLYAFSGVVTPLSETFSASRAGIAGVFGVTLGLANALGFFSGVLADRAGPRPVVIVGGLLIGLGLALASRVDSLWQLYLTFSVGVGLGLAFIKVPATETVEHWFVRRRGFASGLAVSGIGAGNLVGPPVAAALLRAWGWQTLFIVLSAVSAAGIILATRLLAPSPESRGLQPDGDTDTVHAGPRPQGGAAVRDALHSSTFWLLYATVLIGALGAYIPFVHLIPDAESHGIHPVVAAALLGLVGVGSISGRFLVGDSADHFGRRRFYVLAFIGMAICLAWWLVSGQVWSLGLFAVGFGICYGTFFALTPALATDYFGTRHAGAVIGILYTALVPGCVLGPTLAGWAYDLHGSYTVPISASVVTMVAAVLVAMRLPDPQEEPVPAQAAPQTAT